MLSPSGWWLVTAPMDLRCGMDRLLVQVRDVLGRDPRDGRAGISPDLAIRLERAGVSSARFWMTLQANYELSLAEQRIQPKVQRLQNAA